MEAANTVILLLHPITAVAIIGYMWWQYGWKKKSRELKGKSRQEELERHEKIGERILQAAIVSSLMHSLQDGIRGWDYFQVAFTDSPVQLE